MDFFYYLSLGWKVQGSVFGNIKNASFWENIRIILIFRLESFISRNISNFFWGGFFFSVFGDLGWEVPQVAPYNTVY